MRLVHSRGSTLMTIVPLPVFEADADPANRDALTLEEQLAKIEPPEIGSKHLIQPLNVGLLLFTPLQRTSCKLFLWQCWFKHHCKQQIELGLLHNPACIRLCSVISRVGEQVSACCSNGSAALGKSMKTDTPQLFVLQCGEERHQGIARRWRWLDTTTRCKQCPSPVFKRVPLGLVRMWFLRQGSCCIRRFDIQMWER